MGHKYANSIECKFSLDTDVDTFARRIAYLTGSIHLHHFDTDDGFIRLQTADIAYSDQLDRPHVVYIAGRYYTLKEGAQVAEDPSNLVAMIRFTLSPLPTKPQRIEVIATCSEPAVESCLKYLLKDIWENSEEARGGIEQCWPGIRGQLPPSAAELEEYKGRPGRPGLHHNELIYRLARAQEGKEIRKRDPSMTWKEIAKKIKWNKGTRNAGLASLRDARHRLRRLLPGDPLLAETAESRAKETKET